MCSICSDEQRCTLQDVPRPLWGRCVRAARVCVPRASDTAVTPRCNYQSRLHIAHARPAAVPTRWTCGCGVLTSIVLCVPLPLVELCAQFSRATLNSTLHYTTLVQYICSFLLACRTHTSAHLLVEAYSTRGVRQRRWTSRLLQCYTHSRRIARTAALALSGQPISCAVNNTSIQVLVYCSLLETLQQWEAVCHSARNGLRVHIVTSSQF